jgi:hypothetical protein
MSLEVHNILFITYLADISDCHRYAVHEIGFVSIELLVGYRY